jgi:hypothetical protein
MIHNPAMLPKVRSERIMDYAKGQPCSLRIASFITGQRCADNDTCVMCHMPVFGKGTSTKVSDLFVAIGCHTCHAIQEGKLGVELRHRYPAAYTERLWLGMCETQARLAMDGIITIPDAEIIG